MRLLRTLALLPFFAFAASAHVGSPDSFLETKAGPYQLFITVQPPAVIPGVAQVEVRIESPGVREIRAAPLELTGEGAKYSPIPDSLHASKDDPQFFTGSLWLMKSGSAKIKFDIKGDQGEAVAFLPLPAIAQRTTRMQAGLGAVLLGLMSFLVFGLVSISGAAVREAQLDPGAAAPRKRITRSRVVMAAVFLLLAGVVWLGNSWWSNSANDYAKYIYKPLEMRADLDSGNILRLTLTDSGWLESRKVDDFVPDHDHLMHLYLISEPGLSSVYHLHPDMTGAGKFELKLPDMPASHYRLYADVVHEDGFPETLVANINLPDIHGTPLAGDDAAAKAPNINAQAGTTTRFTMPDGYQMLWTNGSDTLKASRPELFKFRLVDANNNAPPDMALYMGMLGHAAFVKTDGSVFAHIHPNGSVAMAALMMSAGQDTQGESRAGMKAMGGMHMNGMHNSGDMAASLPNEVSFPYGFPTPGRYRIFVQMKHGTTIETGVFDADVH
jgi:hypothetical protein